MSSDDPYLTKLYAKRCECVRCGTCDGTGTLHDPFDYLGDGIETCIDCDGSGMTEECDRCMDIREAEYELEFD